jgi:hypothetical protein
MSLTEAETSLDTYIKLIKEYGLSVFSPTSANSVWLTPAISKYGLERVKKEIEPLIPELIEAAYNRGIASWTKKDKHEVERLQLYKSFIEAYNRGETIMIGQMEFKKKTENASKQGRDRELDDEKDDSELDEPIFHEGEGLAEKI